MGKGTGKWELWGEFYFGDGVTCSELITTSTIKDDVIFREYAESQSGQYLYTTIVEEGTYEEEDEDDG
tara:strand:+ start:26 stop:229 length:204 start_codon:yes stop_codon:yes gene_type:complete